jgi:hypothetical protein
MYSMARIFALMTVLVFTLSGCQSHQAKIDALQKEYDRLGLQFRQDCSGEMLKPSIHAQSKVCRGKQESHRCVEPATS